MKKLLLIGNPNVGKSAIFTRLTGVDIISSNYPGTTVEYTKGYMKSKDEKMEIIDVPGIYSLTPASRAEEIAVEMLNEGDVFINVVDATNLERNLNLTLELLNKDIPAIVALNFWDETRHLGIQIDVKELENMLGVPVIPVCGATGEGIKTLVERLPEARTGKLRPKPEERWQEIGRIIGRVQNLTHRHHTILERMADFSIQPLTGIPMALGVMVLTFLIIRLLGEGIISYAIDPLFEKLWLPVMNRLSVFLGPGSLLHNILIGNLIEGKIDFVESFGVLTTGIYVSIAMVLPYVFAFYLVLGFLEDSGYLPRLVVLGDKVMHIVGLHGVSILPMLLGFGCKVPGILALRILESRREKFTSAVLLSVCIPCVSQLAVISGLVGRHGFFALFSVFGVLFLVWFVLGIIIKKSLKGESHELFLEIPPYRFPYLSVLGKKLWMRIRWFIQEAVPFVFFGVLLANVLYAFGIIEAAGRLAGPVITLIFGLPREAAAALLIGFLRKDVAVGMLAPLNLNIKQLIIASTVLTMYFPCLAAFSVLFKELGVKDIVKAVMIVIGTTVIVGGLLNYILR